MDTPDWLARHDGQLRLAPDGRTWLVFFDGAPHYTVAQFPADGKFTCAIAQTENGKRVDKGQTYMTSDEAIRSGLEVLRTYLGW